MKILSYVMIGAGLGGAARYGLAQLVQQRTGLGFPFATLLINVSGSLLLGFIMQYALRSGDMTVETRMLLTTGFCGGYTTFSTFSYETALMLQSRAYGRAGLYVGASVAVSLLATFVGFAVANQMLGARPRI